MAISGGLPASKLTPLRLLSVAPAPEPERDAPP